MLHAASVASCARFFAAAPGIPELEHEGQTEFREVAAASVDVLSVDLQREEHGLVALTAGFRLPNTEHSGELRIDLRSDLERPIVEMDFTFLGVSHVQMRQVEGTDEPLVWISPEIEAELERDTPEIMLLLWTVLNEPRLHAQVGE